MTDNKITLDNITSKVKNIDPEKWSTLTGMQKGRVLKFLNKVQAYYSSSTGQIFETPIDMLNTVKVKGFDETPKIKDSLTTLNRMTSLVEQREYMEKKCRETKKVFWVSLDVNGKNIFLIPKMIFEILAVKEK